MFRFSVKTAFLSVAFATVCIAAYAHTKPDSVYRRAFDLDAFCVVMDLMFTNGCVWATK